MGDQLPGLGGTPQQGHEHHAEKSEGGERLREAVRDGFTIMVGIASWAFEQGDRMLDTWLREGQSSREQGRRRINELADRSRRASEDLSRRVQDTVRSARSSMPLATREQVASLERQVAQLTREIEALRAQGSTTPGGTTRSPRTS